ncbi:MAG: proline--tRNA ligase [Firmicutes bacterium]|uniref:Proline--tRNA ligase n=1 Tax=Candidatus Onthovivens merdipullorum TaxID=2840889 RepID=A0A9D9DKF0_9BACL|nr:proline--tRNA ligase [Candidatus Onthovivens merdipullorum]
METKNKEITSRDVDFAQWYTDVCKKAELMDYSDVKGFIIYRPYGYAIWEEIQNYLDKEFKKTGHENVYLPLVINESLFNKEKEHVEGFAPETLIATIGGNQEIQDRLIIRPTSECLFTNHYAKIIKSYRDLPKLYNQWCNVVRWEKTTRPFLRGSEFLWQEGHTMHRTSDEAKEEALKMLEVYDKMGRDLLAIPFVKGRKTDKEKFAGALETYSIEALMHDGKALQSGTSHYFGDGFAKAFGVNYLDSDGKIKVPYQTSFGVSTRLIGAIIMVHGDDNGLVLPPYVAPTQIVIIPIQMAKSGVMDKCNEVLEILTKAGFRAKLDKSDKTPGWKFNEYEMKGVPLRIEIGPKDVEKNHAVIVRRVDHNKEFLGIDDNFVTNITKELANIHSLMYKKALINLLENIREVHSLDELKEALDKGGYAKMMWCGDQSCEDKIKELYQATARCIPFDELPFDDTCPVCGKKAKYVVLFARAY